MRNRIHVLLVLILTLLLGGTLNFTEAATFTVNSTLDSSDANPGDGIAETLGGKTTLRAAIEEANAFPGRDIINFNLTGPTPYLVRIINSSLPEISESVVIDGTSQNNFEESPVVEIAASDIGGSGLSVAEAASGVVIRGIAIGGFPNAGIFVKSDHDTIQSCYIGLRPDGITANGNQGNGIYLSGASNCLIGGESNSDRNVVAANGYTGIRIYGTDVYGNANSNLVQNNFIGTDAGGTISLGNGTASGTGLKDGISLQALPGWVTGNRISGNLISGNYGNGIGITNADHTTIQNNIIGPDISTIRPLPNGSGIYITDGSYNKIGGTGSHAGNVIGANYDESINISEFQYNNPSAEANANVIQGNFLGTDKSGTRPADNPNDVAAIHIYGADSTIIGGAQESARNIIAYGVHIEDESSTNLADNTIVQNNFIGTDITGSVGFHNHGRGISGRASRIEGNLISGNDNGGISTEIPDGGITILGNKIGTDISGTKIIGNGGAGLLLDEVGGDTGVDTALIGSSAPEDANIIGGNESAGIFLSGGYDISRGISKDIVKIQSNYIGTDTSGTIDLGNAESGIVFPYNNDNLIGGRHESEGNVIAFNGGNGVWLEDQDNGTYLYGVNDGVLGNRIFANRKMGIELGNDSHGTGGVSLNDNNDDDGGVNHHQNYPEFSNVAYDEINNEITATYSVPTSTANATYPLRVEFFKSDSLNQPAKLLGVDSILAADAENEITTTFTPESDYSRQDFLIATATDDSNNTSEQTPLWVTKSVPVNTVSEFQYLRSAIKLVPFSGSTVTSGDVTMKRFLMDPGGQLPAGDSPAMQGYLHVDYLDFKTTTVYFSLNDLKPSITDTSSLQVLWRADPDSAWEGGRSTVFYPQDNPEYIGVPVQQITSANPFPADFRVVTTHGVPVVRTDMAIHLYPDSVRLAGRVQSDTANTTAWFEWGETETYGNQTAMQSIPVSDSLLRINSVLHNLEAGRTYHYRIVASNINGATYGIDRTFRQPDSTNFASLYWTDHEMNSIIKSAPDGSNEITMLESSDGVNSPMATAFDPDIRTIFWTDAGTGSIKKASLANIHDVITVKNGLEQPSGIAIDQINQKLYWSESGSGIIVKSNYDGTEADTLVQDLNTPTSLALDLPENALFFADQDAGQIEKCSLDGDNLDTLAINVSGPYDIVLDKDSREVFWTEPATGYINGVGFDAHLAQVSNSSIYYDLTTPTAIELGRNSFYWSTGRDGKIIRKSRVTNEEHILRTNAGNVTDLLFIKKQAGQLAAFPAQLNFGDVPQRGINAGSVMLVNNSNTDMQVNDISTTGQYFDINNINTPFIISAGDTQRVVISFQPMENGDFQGMLNITAGTNQQITLHTSLFGRGVPAPFLSTGRDSLFAGVPAGQTEQQILPIINNGDANLNFTIPGMAAEVVLQTSSIQNNVGRIYTSNKKIAKGKTDTRQGHPVVLNAGGPDQFGYTWIDSDEDGGPSYEWMDITSVGTHLSLDDDDYTDVSLPFTFSFYGQDQNSIEIGSNGYVTFGQNGDEYDNTELPYSSSPNDLIAPFWKDLSPQNGDNVYYYNDSANDRFIVQYNGVPAYSDDGTYTFQVILYRSGSIMFLYKDMTGVSDDATVGIENSDGSDALQVAFNTSYVHDSLAVQIAKKPEWLSASPASGTIMPDDTLNLQVAFNATSLDTGWYSKALQISSNDPVNPEMRIPAGLRVIPSDAPEMNLIAGDASTTMLPGDSVSIRAEMINVGRSDLFWQISHANDWLMISPNSGTVSHDDSVSISVKVSARELTPGTYLDTLDIETNDVIMPEIKAPVMLRVLDPDSVNFAVLLGVSDLSGNTTALTFGTAGSATDQFDPELDESTSDTHVPGFLWAEFVSDSVNYNSDFKSDATGSTTWNLQARPTANSGPVTLAWDPSRIPSDVSLDITDPASGTVLMDMTSNSTFEMQGYAAVNIELTVPTGNSNNLTDMIPKKYSLRANYPNPFNPTTTIKYGIPKQGKVKITVYNVLGQKVRVLVNNVESAGFHQVTFNASALASGTYFYRIKAGGFVKTRKMTLLK